MVLFKSLIFISLVIRASATNFISKSGSHEITEGQTVRLPCAVHDFDPDVGIIWRKGDEVLFVDTNPLGSDDRYQLDHPDKVTFNLQITNIIPYDSGIFECVISTDPPRIQKQLLSVHVPPDVNMAPEGDSLSAKAGEMVSLKCYPGGNPVPKVTWRKKGGPLPSGNAEFVGEQLVIPKSKEEDSGVYECSASNGVGEDARTSITLVVNSQDSLEDGFAPWVTPDSEYKPVSVGQDVNISCAYDAKPIPTVSWQRHGFPVDLTNRVQVYGSFKDNHSQTIFSIKSITEEEFGEYTCTIQNNFGVKQGRIYVSGFPGPAEIISDTGEAGPKDFILRWRVDSREAITHYRITYRPLHGDKDEIIVPAKHNDLLEEGGTVWESEYEMKGLLRASIAYYIGVEAKNNLGWGSKPQNLLRYLTNKDESRRRESENGKKSPRTEQISKDKNSSSSISISCEILALFLWLLWWRA